VHSHLEDENQESNPLAKEWPSHARLPKKKGKGNLLYLEL
jgi:hypothetical protein